MQYIRTWRPGDERGFTLVELLVVILIIGILAAIALPSFLNQRGKAQDAEAKTKARTAQTALEIYAHDAGSYSGADKAKLEALEPTLKEGGVTVAEPTVSDDSFSIAVTSKTGNVFTVAKASSGAVTRDCTTQGRDGCPDDGLW